MPENKVVFGLKNAHYAVIEENADGEITYSEPRELKGSVELTLEPRGEQTDFYADDILYYTTQSNQGYEATLTVALIPREFRVEVLGEEYDEESGVATENSFHRPKRIAFMFEFDGDIKATRHVLYNCTVSRPTISSSTKTEAAEPNTNELTLVAAPRATDGVVRRYTSVETPDAVYNAWYSAVFNPNETA
jgi:phi13 family phage major tail protein